MKEYATVRRGFFFVFSGAIFGIRWFESFCRLNESISKNLFLAFRGFGSFRRRDGSVLEGTVCKQFMSNTKNRKNLKPCRGFKSFRLLVFHIRFLKNRVYGIPRRIRRVKNSTPAAQQGWNPNLRFVNFFIISSVYLTGGTSNRSVTGAFHRAVYSN